MGKVMRALSFSAVLLGPALAFAQSHSVTLSWTPAKQPNGITIASWNVLRGTTTGGPYTQIANIPVGTTTYEDSSVSPGDTYYYVVQAVDTAGGVSLDSTQTEAAIPTSAPPLAVSTTSLPAATAGMSYIVTITASGGTGPYTWSGTGADGLTFSDAGLLSGTPSQAGTFTQNVTVKDSTGATASASLALSVAQPPSARPLSVVSVAAGDFDGDGKADIAVFRSSSGTWFIIPSSNPSAPIVRQWGTQGDIPVAGDYDGDGKTDMAVFRPSTGTWFIIPSNNPSAPIVRQWGTQGDIPVAGDYDGDGKTDIGVFRPSNSNGAPNGTWFIIPSSNPSAPIIRQWGTQGDIPVPKDYDGDGKTDVAVWRPSSGTWLIIPSSKPGSPTTQQWGTQGDIAVPKDYDGNWKADIAVWRPSSGTWFIIPSTNPLTFTMTQWGTSTDTPVR